MSGCPSCPPRERARCGHSGGDGAAAGATPDSLTVPARRARQCIDPISGSPMSDCTFRAAVCRCRQSEQSGRHDWQVLWFISPLCNAIAPFSARGLPIPIAPAGQLSILAANQYLAGGH